MLVACQSLDVLAPPKESVIKPTKGTPTPVGPGGTGGTTGLPTNGTPGTDVSGTVTPVVIPVGGSGGSATPLPLLTGGSGVPIHIGAALATADPSVTVLRIISTTAERFALIRAGSLDVPAKAFIYQPVSRTATWSVAAAGGGGPLTWTKATIALQSVVETNPANYYQVAQVKIGPTTGSTPPPDVSEKPGSQAGAPAGTATSKPTTAPETPMFIDRPGLPMTFDHTPAELGWAGTFAPGVTVKLAYKLRDDELAQFLRVNERSSRFRLTVAFLDAAGQSLPGAEGAFGAAVEIGVL